jgi:hypothetical protein
MLYILDDVYPVISTFLRFFWPNTVPVVSTKSHNLSVRSTAVVVAVISDIVDAAQANEH